MLDLLIWALAGLAAPATLVCVIDDWFLRPRRQIAAAGQYVDPPLMRVLYAVLPVLLIAAFFQLLNAQRADFSLVLILITLLSGLVWGIDRLWLHRWRTAAAQRAGRDPATIELPGTVDYARSFFPVMAVLLVLRSFFFEPYRIPSDSMMPTLQDGDFILVNKFAYGVRWPVINRKFIDVDTPRRGDVAVFRFPADPAVNYVKRVVGLPGDLVEVRDDQLIINGEPVPMRQLERYQDGCYLNMRLAEEIIDGRAHGVLHCLSSDSLAVAPLPSCNRDIGQSYLCNEATAGINPDLGDSVQRVPEGQYLMVGDNRDNSADGRSWGFVDESLLVGRASVIWFNWDLQRSGGPDWSRIGTRIHAP